MLEDQNFYIMVIVFDLKKYILPLTSGSNPKFKFDEEINKEFKFEDLDKKFLEILIYSLPNNYNIYKENNKLEDLIQKGNFYSGYKIDILTIVFGPKNHNIILLDPKTKNNKGRISYTLQCNQIENINIQIGSTKIELNHLFQNEISLKLKYRDNKNKIDSKYTNGILPDLQLKEKKTYFNYSNNININISTSLFELINSDVSFNLYSSQLINTSLIPKKTFYRKNSNEYKVEDKFFERNPEFKNEKNISTIKLINRYTVLGFVTINFLNILSENEVEINKRASKFFRHVSGLNEESKNINNDDNIFKIKLFFNIENNLNLPLYFNGEKIGKCELKMTIKNIPLIRQVMSGVFTENGFEVNSIHLYNTNLNLTKKQNGTLPSDLKLLIQQKLNLNSVLLKQKNIQITQNKDYTNQLLKILKEIKNTLNKSIEDKYKYLYYGYVNDNDLFIGQNIMLELGKTLIDVVDKLQKETKEETVQILKIINQRSEFDLGTLSIKWFNEDKINKKIFFSSNELIEKKIIKNFLEFNYLCLKYSLETVSRGKAADLQSKFFSGYFLSVVYFRIPIWRKLFLEIISEGIDIEKNIKKNSSMLHTEEIMDIDPINNLILWEYLFYDKLNPCLNYYINNEKYKNDIIELNDVLFKIEDLLKENKQDSIRMNWKELLSKRDFTFFTMVKNLIDYILFEGEGTNEVNWLNIPGFDIIINAILYEIKIRHVKVFPKELIDLFPLFINNINVVNQFIKQITYKTNVYDVQGVFKLIDIIDSIFKKFNSKFPNLLFTKFDYNILSQAMFTTIKIDHSLCVSKFILLYYNNVHLMPMEHIGQICQSIFISKFSDLFFHWSYEVRDKFYFFILYIIGFRIKNKSPFQDMEDLTLVSNHNSNIESSHLKKTFGFILLKKLKIIEEINEVIKKENFDVDFNKINPIKFGDLLKEIPSERYKNILISLNQFDIIYKNFLKWEKINSNKKINEVEYPKIILIPPIDDVVDYEN